MASRSLQNSRRIVSLALQRDRDGRIPDSEFDRMMAEVLAMRSILNAGISLGGGVSSTVAGNFRGQIVDWTFSSTPNTLATIAHGLRVVPVAAIPLLKDRACDIYDSNFAAGWGREQIQLYCSVASAKVKLLILA